MFTLYRLLSQDLQNQNNPENNAEEEPPWYQQISFYRQVLKTHKNYLYLVRRQTDYFLNEIFERLPCYLKKTFVWVDFEAFIVCRTKMPMPYNLKSIAGRRTYLERT